MKITLLGCGYRSLLFAKIIAQNSSELGIDKLCFMDANKTNLAVFGGMAKKITELLNSRIKFTTTDNFVEGFIGADFIISDLNICGDERKIKDERIALTHGVIGHDTLPPMSLCTAARTVPVLTKYCEYAKKYAKPDFKIINITEPVGLITEAMNRLGYDFVYGISDDAVSMFDSVTELLSADRKDLRFELFGLCRLSFFSDISLAGKSIMSQLTDADVVYERSELGCFDRRLVKEKQLIPCTSFAYYYDRDGVFERMSGVSETRAEKTSRLSHELVSLLSNADTENDFNSCVRIYDEYYVELEKIRLSVETGGNPIEIRHFSPFDKDTSGIAVMTLDFIRAISGMGDKNINLCVPNNGALPFLKSDDLAQITCTVTENSITPHRFDSFDPDTAEIIMRAKLCERRAVSFILTGDKRDAVSSLALHPFVNSYTLALELVENNFGAINR